MPPTPLPLSVRIIAEHCLGVDPPLSLRGLMPTPAPPLRRWLRDVRLRCIPPVVVGPLHAGAERIAVTGLRAGATVRIFDGSVQIGVAPAGLEPSVVATVAPALRAGGVITAVQQVGSARSGSSQPIVVSTAASVSVPRVVGPLTRGDTEVLVSGVTPGARVTIRSSGRVIGEARAAEPIVRVPVQRIAASVQPSVRLGSRQATGAVVAPLDEPGGAGPCRVGEADVDLGRVALPDRGPGDGGFESPVRGRFYFPATGSGGIDPAATNRPLVIIAHGFWSNDAVDESLLGYAWLARHLASWNMFVLSVDLSEINLRTLIGELNQSARADLILTAIDRLLADVDHRGRFDRQRIGLVGHSMAGEAVTIAQSINLARPAPLGIRGVVSLAPTHWRPDVSLTETSYLQLHGSLDYLLATGGTRPVDEFNAFRIYDRAWRHRTHVYVVGGRHQGWNPNWWFGQAGEAEGDRVIEGSLDPDEHAEIGRCLINAFFQDTLADRTEYRGYLRGGALPARLGAFDLRVQHHSPLVRVIDDFGDADPQLGLSAEVPPDQARNRRNGQVRATGLADADDWDDIEMTSAAHSVHDTRCTELAWMRPGVVLETAFAPVAQQATHAISVRVAQHYDERGDGVVETWNPIGLDGDLLVELRGGGATSVVRAGSVATIPYPAPASPPLSIPRTIRIPLDAFVAANPRLDLGALDRVRLHLVGRPTGRVHVDDIEFTR